MSKRRVLWIAMAVSSTAACAAQEGAPDAGLVVRESTEDRLAASFTGEDGTRMELAALGDGQGWGAVQVTRDGTTVLAAPDLDTLEVSGLDVYSAMAGDGEIAAALAAYGSTPAGQSLIDLSSALEAERLGTELAASAAGTLSMARTALVGLALCTNPFDCENAFSECFANCTTECYALFPPPDPLNQRPACISSCRNGCRRDREECLRDSCI